MQQRQRRQKENVAASSFKNRIRLYEADARSWVAQKRYDLVICNPPFFINSLPSPEHSRNIARHSVLLEHQDIVDLFKRTLRPDGQASILMPPVEWEQFNRLANASGLYLQSVLKVSDQIAAPVKRIVAMYAQRNSPHLSGTLAIKDSNGDYTMGFISLMSPYYLHL